MNSKFYKMRRNRMIQEFWQGCQTSGTLMLPLFVFYLLFLQSQTLDLA